MVGLVLLRPSEPCTISCAYSKHRSALLWSIIVIPFCHFACIHVC